MESSAGVMPLESLISRALDAASLGERSIWLQAEIAREAADAYGMTPGAWGSSIGRSASWVRQAVRTSRVFGDESLRCDLLSYSIHATCAGTSDPHGWLARSESNEWSVADLKRAIRNAGAVDEEEEARTAGERILQRLRRWADDAPADVRREVVGRVRAWATGQG